MAPATPAIQGFATDISVNQGQTVGFKIDTTVDQLPDRHLPARLLRRERRAQGRDRSATAALPQTQPAAVTDADRRQPRRLRQLERLRLVGGAGRRRLRHLRRAARPATDDAAAASHIAFIVRDDDGGSDLLFQTSDTTWQAYNSTAATASTRRTRPDAPTRSATTGRSCTRGTPTEDWLFNAEYPMLRWLERNGYDVSYFTGVDADRVGAELLEHKVFLSVGHDEYWSAAQRANVEAARDAGVNLAFFSGNEVFWKTRWEPSTADGGSTPTGRSSPTRKARPGRRALRLPATSPAIRTGHVDGAVASAPPGTTAAGPRTR